MTDLLELRGVSVFYGQRAALDSVTLGIPHGAQVAVVGPNGAGKSTLFKALMGLAPLRSGEILLHGRPPSEYRDPIAYVPQREEVDWRFPVTVFDVVAMGRYGRGRWLKRLTASGAIGPLFTKAWNVWTSWNSLSAPSVSYPEDNSVCSWPAP